MDGKVFQAIAAKQGVENEWLAKPGVTGIDVGFKYVSGRRTDEIAIRVLVAKKDPSVAQSDKVPPDIAGIKTDVIERTFFLHDTAKNRKSLEDISLQADAGTYNPVKGGISIGPCRAVGGFVYVGTLGAIVKDNASGNPLLLSNFHVMCIDNGWHVGDTMAQPGRVDGGTCPANVVGTLERAALTASVDGAVCSLTGRSYSCEIVDIGPVTGTVAATLNMPVRKRGRTTGLTYGFVDSVSLSVNIDYGDGIGSRTLTNQIGIRPDTARNAAFGDHGDSGSAVVDGLVKVVGLHFAGSSDGHGVANQIAEVLSTLNVSMCAAAPKNQLKDTKDLYKEKLEIKEFKQEKLEYKDYVKEREKSPIKDYKDLFEKIFDGSGKGVSEAGPMPQQPGAGQGTGQGLGGIEARIAQLEAIVNQLSTFITADLRPNLSTGALRNETSKGCGSC